MQLPSITTYKELAELVNEIGFLPFFKCSIDGFSLSECTPKEYWFVDGVEGPWEWKGYVIQDAKMAYGKFFNKKAGFISLEWLPAFCNYRRDGYDFEGFCEDGRASYMSKQIYDSLCCFGPKLSRDLKRELCRAKHDSSSFDSAVASLQMDMFVAIKSFEYARDKFGKPYGWGIAKYALLEQLYTDSIINGDSDLEPAESKEKIIEQVMKLYPSASVKQAERLIR